MSQFMSYVLYKFICFKTRRIVNLNNFTKNFIFANSVKRHICHVKKWHGYDLPISVDNRVISQGFYFQENKSHTKISEFIILP